MTGRTGRYGSRARLAPGFAFAILLALAFPAAAAPSMPVAVGARVEHDVKETRLIFEISGDISAVHHLLSAPDRLIVDLPEVNFQVEAGEGGKGRKTAQALSGGLVKGFRFGLFAPGRSRIVVDLAGPARVERIASAPQAGGAYYHLVIALSRTSRALFTEAADEARAARRSAAAESAGEPVAVQPGRGGRPLVVLDPGHGGVDPGASGAGGSVEKTIVLDFALETARLLEAMGRYEVVMTRQEDIFVSLDDRVKIARSNKAALFVSLHADTITAQSDVRGATIYTVSDRASDAEAARLADKENSADQLAGVESVEASSEVNDILFDLTRRETRGYAHLFSRTLGGLMAKATRLNTNPYRSAGFKVLKAPDVPSILIELGYLSSERDAKAMASSEWRSKTAKAVADAIDTFLAQRLHDPTEQAGERRAAAASGDVAPKTRLP